MGQPPDDGGDGRPRGNLRLLVAGLIAVIVGLVIAIIVIAGDDGGSDTVPTPTELSTLPTESAPPTETTETTTEEMTDEAGQETEETTPTTEAPEEAGEEGGSGGLEAP
jgi:hypothetical protein